MNPLTVIVRSLSRLAPVIPDTASLLPQEVGSYSDALPALAYAAAASGLISWDSLQDASNGLSPDKPFEVGRLINQVRAGQHLAADFVQDCESKELSPEEICERLNLMSPADERRPHIIFYLTLKQFQGATTAQVKANAQAMKKQAESIEMFEASISNRIIKELDRLEETVRQLSSIVQNTVAFNQSYETERNTLASSIQKEYSECITDPTHQRATQVRKILRQLEDVPVSASEHIWNRLQPTVARVTERAWLRSTGGTMLGIRTQYARAAIETSFRTYTGILLQGLIEHVEADNDILSMSIASAIDDWIQHLNSPVVEDLLSRGSVVATSEVRAAIKSERSDESDARPKEFIFALVAELSAFLQGVPKASDETFARAGRAPSYLDEFMSRTITSLIKQRTNIVLGTAADARQSIAADYARSVAGVLDSLELLGIEYVDPVHTQYRLSIAYIMLRLADSDKEVFTEKTIGSSRRLAVRGVAGSGKTTFLKWIAVNCSRRSFEDKELQPLNGIVPLFVRLRDFRGKDLPHSLREFVTSLCPAVRTSQAEEWITSLAKAGDVILLFDGIDEVSATDQGRFNKWLKKICTAFPKIRVIVSGRPNALPTDGTLAKIKFKTFEIAPMRLTAVREFVRKWHEAVIAEIDDPAEKNRVLDHEQRLVSVLEKSKELQSIAKRPLLCAMICLLHKIKWTKTGDTPTRKVDIYRECVRALLYSRDAAREIDTSDYPAVNEEQRWAIIEAVAYWMLDNDALAISETMAMEVMGRVVSTFPKRSQFPSMDNLLRLFVERTAILLPVGVNELEFPHRSLLEYCAARAVADRCDVGKLIRHAEHREWHDVIIMASSILGSAQRNQLIGGLISKAEKCESRPMILLLAASCVDDAPSILDDVMERLTIGLEEFFPPFKMDLANQVAKLGEIAIPRLAIEKTRKVAERRACIRALGIIGGEQAFDALKEYATSATKREALELVRAAESLGKAFSKKLLALIPIRLGSVAAGKDFPAGYGTIDDCRTIFSNPDSIDAILLRTTHEAHILDCSGHKSLPVLSAFSGSVLVLDKCWNLENIDNIATLTSLQHLTMLKCDSLGSCAAIADLPNLKSLRLTRCRSLVDIRPLQYMRRCTMTIAGIPSGTYIPAELLDRDDVKVLQGKLLTEARAVGAE